MLNVYTPQLLEERLGILWELQIQHNISDISAYGYIISDMELALTFTSHKLQMFLMKELLNELLDYSLDIQIPSITCADEEFWSIFCEFIFYEYYVDFDGLLKHLGFPFYMCNWYEDITHSGVLPDRVQEWWLSYWNEYKDCYPEKEDPSDVLDIYNSAVMRQCAQDFEGYCFGYLGRLIDFEKIYRVGIDDPLWRSLLEFCKRVLFQSNRIFVDGDDWWLGVLFFEDPEGYDELSMRHFSLCTLAFIASISYAGRLILTKGDF